MKTNWIFKKILHRQLKYKINQHTELGSKLHQVGSVYRVYNFILRFVQVEYKCIGITVLFIIGIVSCDFYGDCGLYNYQYIYFYYV